MNRFVGKRKVRNEQGEKTMSLQTRIFRQADPFDAVQRDLDQLLGRIVGPVEAPVASYPVDVREDNDHLTVEAELPGFKKEEVDITLENHVLTITAEHLHQPAPEPKADNDNGSGYLLKERRRAKFSRSFRLPLTVEGSAVDAKLENGVLTVSLNKRQEAKPRKITVA